MALDVGAVFVPVLPDLKGFAPAMQKGLGSVSSGLSLATAAAGAGALALGAFAVAGVKAALDFDRAFTKIAAISNTSAGAIAGMKEEVLALSGETAVAPTELADALFFLASAGLDASEVMPALEASAKASAVGLGDTADIANIVASALNAYADSGLTAAAATDILVAAVREGRAEPEEFANALGRILPIASTVGVTFDQVAASMAALSNIGLDVNEGVTAMRGVLQAIAAPGTQAAEAMNKLGLSAQQLLDAISEHGVIGALRLLDKAAQKQTDTQAAYNDILRKIVPNVRALTGVFGLTVQEASKVDVIFQNVLHSTGALSKAFKITSQSDAFRLRKALNDLSIIAQRFGSTVLPAVVDALTNVATILTVVTGSVKDFDAAMRENIRTAVQWELDIAGAMESVLGKIPFVREAVNVWRSVDTAMQGTADSAALTEDQLTLVADAIRQGDPTLLALQDRFTGIADSFLGVSGKANVMGANVQLATDALFKMFPFLAPIATGIEHVGKAAGKAGNQLSKVGKDIQAGLVAKLPGIIGTVTTYKDTFTLSPAELVKISASWARIARTIAHDLRVIGNSDLKPAMREAIAALPPEMRNAWVRGTAAQRGAIEKSTKTALDVEPLIPGLARKALTGGAQVGADLARGITQGIQDNTAQIAAAAANAVDLAIRAARAAAQAASPSKKMRQLGLDLMKGLEQGIGAGLDGVISALMSAEGEWTKAWLRQAKSLQAFGDAMTKEFDKLMDKVDTFRDSIRSGLAVDLVDVLSSALAEYQQALEEFNAASAAGTLEPGQVAPTLDLGGVLAAQVAQTEAFADALKGLSEAGLDKGLLADLASKGVSALPLAQQLLQDPALLAQFENAAKTINQIAQQTSGKLVEAAFGPALDRAAERAERFADKLSRFVKALNAEALGHEVDDVIHALHRLSNALGGPGGGGNTDKIAASFGAGQEITINVKTDLPAAVELIDQGLAGKGKNNVRLAHHGRD